MSKWDKTWKLKNLFGRSSSESAGKESKVIPKDVNLPAGRVSQPPASGQNILSDTGFIETGANLIVSPRFIKDLIPIIRALVYMNEDVSQAVWNVCSLGNTGHKILFDPGVSADQQDKMRQHLANRAKDWSSGQPNINGLVNKMFWQCMIGGALSGEWVPNSDLTGIEGHVFVNPEDIEWKLTPGRVKYHPYQRVKNTEIPSKNPFKNNLIKLNTATFKYFGLNGDTDYPMGIPPYMPVLPGLKTQKNMKDNIDFIVSKLGLLGFLEVLIDKPTVKPGGSDTADTEYLTGLLEEAKSRIEDGMKEGIVVGYKEDVEFNYNSISKDFESALRLFENNEVMLASALKMDGVLLGRGYNTSETQITVVFMKMLSELKNIQNLVSASLEFGYSLDLILAGFKFDYLTVRFNRSTLQDDLKFQQADEIRIRNVVQKYIMGVISLEQAADELGYDKPAEAAPLVSPEVLAGKNDAAEQDEKNKGDEKKSEKKTRDKNKPTGSKK